MRCLKAGENKIDGEEGSCSGCRIAQRGWVEIKRPQQKELDQIGTQRTTLPSYIGIKTGLENSQ